MTSHEIQEWKKISANYSDTLLIGNGASIAVNKSFNYGSLFKYAKDPINNLMSPEVEKLFKSFKTEDFELVLRLVWQASEVNSHLGIKDKDNRAHDAYFLVRDCLIKSVRGIHPGYDEVSQYLPYIYRFLKKFKTVLSLNYDLILYWAMMYGNSETQKEAEKESKNKCPAFIDCFDFDGKDPSNRGELEFSDNLQQFREKYDKSTSVFYPHGNLIFRRNIMGSESKIRANDKGTKRLLEVILESWKSEKFVPLFVSEGTTEQKIASIQNSYYLSTVYREVLTDPTDSLVIYGWSLDDRDIHILERMSNSGIKRVAVSVHGKDDKFAYRDEVSKKIRDALEKPDKDPIDIAFFDSESHGCWNKPKGHTFTRSQNLGQA